MNRELIEELISSNYRVAEYSGRAMFGRSCVSIHVPSIAHIGIVGALLHQKISIDEIKKWFEGDAKHDQLGLGYVVYFPSMKW